MKVNTVDYNNSDTVSVATRSFMEVVLLLIGDSYSSYRPSHIYI